MKKRYILLACLVLFAYVTLACDGDPCIRLDGTNGCEVENAVPSDPESYWSDAW